MKSSKTNVSHSKNQDNSLETKRKRFLKNLENGIFTGEMIRNLIAAVGYKEFALLMLVLSNGKKSFFGNDKGQEILQMSETLFMSSRKSLKEKKLFDYKSGNSKKKVCEYYRAIENICDAMLSGSQIASSTIPENEESQISTTPHFEDSTIPKNEESHGFTTPHFGEPKNLYYKEPLATTTTGNNLEQSSSSDFENMENWDLSIPLILKKRVGFGESIISQLKYTVPGLTAKRAQEYLNHYAYDYEYGALGSIKNHAGNFMASVRGGGYFSANYKSEEDIMQEKIERLQREREERERLAALPKYKYVTPEHMLPKKEVLL